MLTTTVFPFPSFLVLLLLTLDFLRRFPELPLLREGEGLPMNMASWKSSLLKQLSWTCRTELRLPLLLAAAAGDPPEDEATMSGKVKRSWLFLGDLQQLATVAELGGVGIPPDPPPPLGWCRDLDPGDLGLRLSTDV